MKCRKIKYLNKINRGNTSLRKDSQIIAAIIRMITNNPMKEPLNQVNQSIRMMGNQLWRLRKKVNQTATIRLDGVDKGENKAI